MCKLLSLLSMNYISVCRRNGSSSLEGEKKRAQK